jgi:hypothetical protein
MNLVLYCIRVGQKLEDSIRFSLERYYKEGVGNERKYKLIDVDGKDITPSELGEKYFSSPEGCFIKDDETLNAENMARNIASVSNHLYSQSIQHKITPLACNNILTELYNNHIEDNHDDRENKVAETVLEGVDEVIYHTAVSNV